MNHESQVNLERVPVLRINKDDRQQPRIERVNLKSIKKSGSEEDKYMIHSFDPNNLSMPRYKVEANAGAIRHLLGGDGCTN